MVGDVRIMLFKEVDPAAEAERISKEIARVTGQIAKSKESSPTRGSWNAPRAAVVEQERKRLADSEETLLKLQDQLQKLRGRK